MVASQVTSFSCQCGALRGIELTEHGAHTASGVFSIGHLAEEVDAHFLEGLCCLDGVDGVVKWCAQVHNGDVRGVLLWERSDLLLWKKAFERRVCGTW
jgi:hypothetical protein